PSSTALHSLSLHDALPILAGRLARDRGYAGEASSKCQQALDTFEESGAVFEAARTRLDLAEMAFEGGDTSRACRELAGAEHARLDRKSTRLNSSHLGISYA